MIRESIIGGAALFIALPLAFHIIAILGANQ